MVRDGRDYVVAAVQSFVVKREQQNTKYFHRKASQRHKKNAIF